jgi:hypothetical protein
MDYNSIATKESKEKTIASLNQKGYEVFNVENANDALEKIKEIIPEGVSVMNGSSTTLNQIGFTDYLKSGEHKWNNLHAAILAEKDPEKQAKLRRESVLSDFYLGSVHALIENGEFIIASNTASQLPHVVFTSPNLIFVVSTKKIVKTNDDAFKRLESHVIPLENERIQKLYHSDTMLNKIVIFKGENPMLGRKVTFILVDEDLGF